MPDANGGSVEKQRISDWASDTTEEVEVAIVGMGFAGIAAALKLREAKIGPMVCFEKEEEVGGTWWVNTYPGCACDIPSHLYSLSFEPSAEWSRMFPTQPEISAYLKDVVRRTGLHGTVIRYRTQVLEARWLEKRQVWRLSAEDLNTGTTSIIHARYLIESVGPLAVPAMPNIKGLREFSGVLIHTARWDHSVNLKDKRVAVIGTGASATQVIPAIAPTVRRLIVFQRSPPWVLGRNDYVFSDSFRWMVRTFPVMRGLFRAYIFWAWEMMAPAVHNNWFTRFGTTLCDKHRMAQVTDETLRAKLRPSYTVMCKRIIVSDDYYPALQRPNVELVTGGIREVTSTAVVDNEGNEHQVDVIVLATGYEPNNSMTQIKTMNASGATLQETWNRDGWKTKLGISCSEYPNLFITMGPHTALGHNSVVLMIEAQARYIISVITQMRKCGAAVATLKRPVQETFYAEMRRRLASTVWLVGGCSSWYKSTSQDQTSTDLMWPGTVKEYQFRCRAADLSEYELKAPNDAPVEPSHKLRVTGAPRMSWLWVGVACGSAVLGGVAAYGSARRRGG